MKEKLIAHWGKVILLVSVAFCIISFQQASAYKEKISNARKQVDKVLGRVHKNLDVYRPDLSSHTALANNLSTYYHSSAKGEYKINVKPNAEAEDWDIKKQPYKVMVNSNIIVNVPSTSKSEYLKDLSRSDNIILIQSDNFDGKIECVKVKGKNQLKVTGIESSLETIMVTIRNKSVGDMAKFHVKVDQQIKLYHYVPLASLKTQYNKEESLDTVSLSWRRSSISITDEDLLAIKSYSLLRKTVLPDTDPAKAKYVELQKWASNKCPFKFVDKVKPLHSYSYKIQVEFWHTPEVIPPTRYPTLNPTFPSAAVAKEWLITKSKNVDYTPTKLITIGKGKILLGFQGMGFTGSEVELMIKKWDNGQWISGNILISKTKNILQFGNEPNFFPKLVNDKPMNKETINAEIKKNNLLEISGKAKSVRVEKPQGGAILRNIAFDIDYYVIYKIVKHEANTSMSKLLIDKNYPDKESFGIVYDKEKNAFIEECHSVWMVDKRDPYFQKETGHAFPKSLLIYFGNSEVRAKLKKVQKELNAKVDIKKVDIDPSNITPLKKRTPRPKKQPKESQRLPGEDPGTGSNTR